MFDFKDRLAPWIRTASALPGAGTVGAMITKAMELAGPLAAPIRAVLSAIGLSSHPRAQLHAGGPVPVVEEVPHSDVRAALRAERKRREEMENQLAEISGELESSKLELLGQTTKLRNEVHDLEERNAELLERVVSLTQKERALAQKVVDTRFQGSGVKADKERLESEIRDIKRKQANTAEELDRAREASAHAEAQIVSNRDRLKRLEQDREQAQRTADEAAAARAAAEARVAELERALDEARQPGAVAARATGSSPAPGDHDKNDLATLHDAVSELQVALQELRSAVGDEPKEQPKGQPKGQDLADQAEKDENTRNETDDPA